VKKGVPFRDANEAVARAVKHAMAEGVDLMSCRSLCCRFHPRSAPAGCAHLARSLASRNVVAARRRASEGADRTPQGTTRDADRLSRPPRLHTEAE
jgi:argininosuccinate lyase